MNSLDNINVAHRIALRKIINIPRMSHNNLTYAITNTLPVNVIAQIRFCTFFQKFETAENALTQHFAHIAKVTKLTHSSNNLFLICNKYPTVPLFNIKQHIKTANKSVPDQITSFCAQLLHLRHHNDSNLTLLEINQLIGLHFLCTN